MTSLWTGWKLGSNLNSVMLVGLRLPTVSQISNMPVGLRLPFVPLTSYPNVSRETVSI